MDDTAIDAEHDTSGEAILPRIAYLSEKLRDAELLLAYAAEAGVDLDANIRRQILNARVAELGGHWTAQLAEEVLSALTTLAAKLRPVTVQSIRLCADRVVAEKTLHVYKTVTIALAVLIVPFSFATFVGSALSGTIRDDLDTANKLAVTVSNEVSPVPQQTSLPPTAQQGATALRKGAAEALQRGISEQEVIRNLQEFAAITRSIYAHARQLNMLLMNGVTDPYAAVVATAPTDHSDRKDVLELPPDLPDLVAATTQRISVYQGIRYFAQTVQGSVATVYGAFAACVLPVLYAVLGACAYLLRLFEQQVKSRTLEQTDAHVAHFVVAAISGAVIGLFSNLNFGQGASLSPMALAFLVGYAVDVFFSFLEGIIQSVSRSRTAGATQGVEPQQVASKKT